MSIEFRWRWTLNGRGNFWQWVRLRDLSISRTVFDVIYSIKCLNWTYNIEKFIHKTNASCRQWKCLTCLSTRWPVNLSCRSPSFEINICWKLKRFSSCVSLQTWEQCWLVSSPFLALNVLRTISRQGDGYDYFEVGTIGTNRGPSPLKNMVEISLPWKVGILQPITKESGVGSQEGWMRDGSDARK